MTCGVSFSQFFCRVMSIIIGLIIFFRDHSAGRITFISKWLDIHTRDSSKSKVSGFFFVQNDWNCMKEWGKQRDLLIPLHVGAEDLLRMLNLPDVNTLHYEVHFLSKYVDEEYLFKVGLSTQAGRSHALLSEKESKSKAELSPFRVIKEFKKSVSFKIVQNQVQEARDHIYDIEVKTLELECIEAEIEGLTPSQASSDSSSDLDGDEIESELQKVFAPKDDDVGIL
ncbi:hypothetical protein IEQ34_003006 [Dendrobium chrysotoxum]|uniref:Uncharacterized protein n=1 Tax=Dendrobium chrysotoxum TaxID=161865 RepID=A0AAV7HKJ6_DENCH|nr:hypothetical protein IEQ34_003006 [Dendrobium chrysotoxum]